jgi:PIN domain nuclease of toxin-antitoxin system
VAKGRLSMSCSVQSWVRQALALPGVQLAPLSPDIALESAALPSVFHGDPADRIIVATARIFDARLVTRDEKILTYASEGWVNVLL